MGVVYQLSCRNKRCRYGKTIWELFWAHGYRSVHNTWQEVEDGVWGEEIRETVLTKQGILDIAEYLYVCDKCSNMETLPSLSYRRSKKGTIKTWSEINSEVESREINKEFYEEPILYNHCCVKCGENMRQIKDLEHEKLLCPLCGRRIYGKTIGIS